MQTQVTVKLSPREFQVVVSALRLFEHVARYGSLERYNLPDYEELTTRGQEVRDILAAIGMSERG